MAKYLVIVESPAKVKTIKKFLGANYEVAASNGHVRDFPKSQFGIDVEHDYEPKYITIRGKGDILANLRKEVKKAEKIYLATDPDREGEAISWHLMEALKLSGVSVARWHIAAYVISGFFVGLAAVAYAATFPNITPGTGAGFELDAIGSAIIGGTAMSGGSGSVVGTFLGVLLISLLKTGLPFINLQANWQQVITGCVLLAAVTIDMQRNRKRA